MSETTTAATTTGENNEDATTPSGGETPDTEAAASAGGVGAASEATGSAAQDGGVPHPSPSPAAPGESWERRRLNTMTARAKEYNERLAKYENPDGTPKTPVPSGGEAPGSSPTGASPAEIQRLASIEAERILFNREAERVANEGRAAFPDFDRRVQQLVALTDGDPVAHSSYVNLVRVALETGQGAQILHRLGGAPEEAERLLRLNPVQQAIQVSRLVGDAAATGVSAAPKPITPVNGGGTRAEIVDPTDPARADKLSTAEWMKRRNAQLADKRKRA